MQAAKRSQVPLPSQVTIYNYLFMFQEKSSREEFSHVLVCNFQMVDDRIILDNTVLEQVSLWKKSKGLTDKAVTGHICLGTKCSYHQIDDVFICKETGNVHGM